MASSRAPRPWNALVGSMARGPLLAGLVLVSLLPHLSAAWPGLTYYFRDFSVAFYPLRLFAARELAAGRLAFWNPYFQEGSFALPTLYPPDLLHVLWPSPAAVSWILTMHYPLAALSAYFLARDLGASRVGSFVSGSTFALGGLALSSLNLYVFLQSLALAPLVVVTLRRAARRGGPWIPIAALALALSISTLALEFVIQAFMLGIALGLSGTALRQGALRLATAAGLGLGLAGLPIALTLGVLPETVRGAGFGQEIVLANEVHPASLLQVLIPGIFGSLSRPAELWWGSRFFTKGFPYFLSLYLGPLVLALACVGLAALPRNRWLFLGWGIVGLWYSLGARGGLATLCAHLPLARSFRYPSKALLLPYIVAAVCAGFGADRLWEGLDWKRFAKFLAALAGLALAVSLLALGPIDALIPAPFSAARVKDVVFKESLQSSLLAALGVGIAVCALLKRLASTRAAALLALLLVVDLARAGAGMNPQVPEAFFHPLPELAGQHLDQLGGGRVFTYGVDYSPSFRQFLAQHNPGFGLWSFFVNRQMLSPYSNILDRVEIPEAKDLTSLVPRTPELGLDDYDPGRVGSILGRLRNSAVSRIVSLDPLVHPDLRMLVQFPLGPPGLTMHVYELLRPWPRAYFACHVVYARDTSEALEGPMREDFAPAADVLLNEKGTSTCQKAEVIEVNRIPGRDLYDVQADGTGYLVTRDSFAGGWRASLDGKPVGVLRANGKHRGVWVPAGHHRVVFEYEPPGLKWGLGLTALAAAGTLGLWLRSAGRADLPE